MKVVNIVFDGPPGPKAGRFVEVEDHKGKSISFGEWEQRHDGYWNLKIPFPYDESKPVYVAWSNSDLTEGKGREIVHAVCESRTTAIRHGEHQSVQGSNCRVTEELALRVGGRWLAPTRIVPASKEDLAVDKRRQEWDQAIAKGRAAGLTDADIEALQNYQP